MARIVVKVGGSLFDLPDLGPRLRAWLAALPTPDVLLVPGGGPTADVIRDLDRCHRLGEEAAHWLALRALALNAHFLAAVLPGAVVTASLESCGFLVSRGAVPVLDAHAFAHDDEGRPGCLPHTWDVTSDSLAARVALAAGARELVLLKSVSLPEPTDWAEEGRRGRVDPFFAGVAKALPAVRAVNLRQRRP
ncbi:MAG TPA: hypothetical protein VFA26_24845 [Gemmataceae bacterium]|nr:hypothetical protein [Gemmataceae bacterium]